MSALVDLKYDIVKAQHNFSKFDSKVDTLASRIKMGNKPIDPPS